MALGRAPNPSKGIDHMGAKLLEAAAALDAALAENERLLTANGEVTLRFARDLDAAEAECERLREAGGFMMGWHPTDPDHPAFMETVDYGTAMMLVILSDEPYSTEQVSDVFEKMLAQRRAALETK